MNNKLIDGNPELAEGFVPRASVETLHRPPHAGEEKVHSLRKLGGQSASPEPTPAALTQWRCENLPNSGNPKLHKTADTPTVGDIRPASELGYRGHALYRFSSCQSCGQARWVRLLDYQKGQGVLCRSCGYPSSNLHTRKLQNLIDAGAKRASEIGKPVFKSRDPWYYPHKCPSCGEIVYHQHKDLYRVCKKCAYVVRKTAKGDSHPNWNGGRYRHGDGYIVVQASPDSPYYSTCDVRGYVLEHRLIMAESLGRCLGDGEVVHHINGDKSDNRIENLELLPGNVEHLPYIKLQQHIYRLQEEVSNQAKEIRLLKWRIREMEQGNPELAKDSCLWASVEAIQEAPPMGDEERVRPSEKLED